MAAGEGPVREAVHRPDRAAHQRRGQNGLGEELEIAGLFGGVLPDEKQVQAHDDQIAAQGGDGRAVDVDFRIPHQDIVHYDFGDAAGDDGEDGQFLLSVGLENGVGQNHEADKDGGQAQDLQMGAGSHGGLLPAGQDQPHNGGGQHREAHTRRNSQHGDDPESGGDNAVRLGGVPLGDGRRGEGNQAHGNGVDKGGHHVGHIHGHAVLAVEGRRLHFGQQQGVLEPPHDNLCVDEVDDAQGGVPQGNGDADGQHLPQNRPAGGGGVQGLGAVPVGQEVRDQKEDGQDGARGDAEDCPGGHVRHGLLRRRSGQAQNIPGQRQPDTHLAQRLQHLADGGGGHVPLTLGIAPHTGQQTHAEHRRGQGADGLGGHGVFLKGRQLLRAEEHQQGPRQPQDEEQPDGRAEDLPLLILLALGVGLTGELGDGQGQTGRCEDIQKIVDEVGGVEVGLAHLAQDVVQRQLVDRADELHHHHGGGQNGRAAHKGLLFGWIGHENTSEH